MLIEDKLSDNKMNYRLKGLKVFGLIITTNKQCQYLLQMKESVMKDEIEVSGANK